MTKSIYFLRHGHYLLPHPKPKTDETEQANLSVMGIEQTIRIALKIKRADPSIYAIFSSPYVRSLETASLVAKVFKLKIEVNTDLEEQELEDETAQHFEHIYKKFKRCIHDLLKLDHNIIVVSHELPISVYLSKESGVEFATMHEDHSKLELLKMGECIKVDYENLLFQKMQKI